MKLRIIAPLRIDIGGGVTDIPQFSQEVGTAITSIAVDPYQDPDHRRPRGVKVEISPSLGKSRLYFNNVECDLRLKTHDELYLIKSIALNYIKRASMAESLIIEVFDTLPRGTGLGGSAVLSLCLLAGLQQFSEHKMVRPSTDIIAAAHRFETIDLGIRGGFQDYIAAYFGGFNYINFPSLDNLNTSTLNMALASEAEEFFNQNMIVAILNNENISSNEIVKDEVAQFDADRAGVTTRLLAIKEHNTKLYEILHQEKWHGDSPGAIGAEINKSWEQQKQLSRFVGRERLKDMELRVGSMIYGLRGPGAAGNSLFMLTKPENKAGVLSYLDSLGDEVSVLFPRINKAGLEISRIN